MKEYLVIQEEPLSPEDPKFVEIGQTKSEGEKILLVYFDLEKAVTENVIGEEKWDISVTDSKMNFR